MARKPRFLLDPNESAMENLWRGARISSIVVLCRYSWFGLTWDSRKELLEDIVLYTVRHFIEHKVLQHKYMRETADGRKKLTFLDNLISSSWSVARERANQYIRKVVNFNARSISLSAPWADTNETIADAISAKDVLTYRPKQDNKAMPYEQLKPFNRAVRVSEMYHDYCEEATEIGVEPMGFQRWLSETEYGEDHEMLFFLLPKEEQRELLREEKHPERIVVKVTDVKQPKKEKRHRMTAEELRERHMSIRRQKQSLELPPGHRFVTRDGIVYIERIAK